MTPELRTVLAVGAMLAVGPLVLPEFYVTLLNYIGLYSLVTLGLVLLTGVCGLTSFGQAAFVGIGAYVTAVLTTAYGLSPWLGLAAGAIATVLAAVGIGLITLRLSGHYLPLSTLAWGISLYFVFGNFELLGGHTGLTGIPAIPVLGVELDTGRKVYYLIWITVLAAIVLVTHLLDSRIGRALRALKGGALMAESFGISTPRIKMIAFVIAAVLAAVSGWLYAHLLRFVNPTPFGLNIGIEYLFMAVVGGVGHVWGAVVGAALITILKQVLQDTLPGLLGRTGNFELIVLGVLMIVLLQHARDGVIGSVAGLLPSRRPAAGHGTGEALASRKQPQRGQPLLEVRDAVKQFGGLLAVNRLSFDVRVGEIVGLIGPNGAGKSTMFNLITGVLPATAGEIHFMGARIDRMPARDIARKGIARTFQHVHLLPAMSVLDNVMIGAHLRGTKGTLAAALRLERREEAALRREAVRQLERVGLGAVLHEQAGSLPLGQQRILEIARALSADPILLLLDEPAAGLRHHEKRELARLLRSLREDGVTILLVEHDMDFVMGLVERLVVMDFGDKLAQGLPQEIQSNPRVLEAYLGGVV